MCVYTCVSSEKYYTIVITQVHLSSIFFCIYGGIAIASHRHFNGVCSSELFEYAKYAFYLHLSMIYIYVSKYDYLCI